MKRALFILIVAALGVTWWFQRLSAVRLTEAVDKGRAQLRELATLQQERDRLRAKQPGDEELNNLRRAAGERSQLQAMVNAQDATPAASRPLPLGEWSPAAQWKNRGQATPHAALETALWAAAGGDVARLHRTLSLDEVTRAKADALLAQLSSAAREHYPSSEDLVAEFTVKNIPLGWAQLVWFNQTGDDTANAAVFLQQGAPGDPTEAPAPLPSPLTREEAIRLAAQRKAEREANKDRPPPQALDDGKGSVTYLNFQRTDGEWRLVVPPNAIDKMAKDLGLAPSK